MSIFSQKPGLAAAAGSPGRAAGAAGAAAGACANTEPDHNPPASNAPAKIRDLFMEGSFANWAASATARPPADCSTSAHLIRVREPPGLRVLANSTDRGVLPAARVGELETGVARRRVKSRTF